MYVWYGCWDDFRTGIIIGKYGQKKRLDWASGGGVCAALHLALLQINERLLITERVYMLVPSPSLTSCKSCSLFLSHSDLFFKLWPCTIFGLCVDPTR